MGEASSASGSRGLRILAPVDRVEEVALLAAAGAHELYGGVQPEKNPSALSVNQRTFASAQFGSEASFAEAAREAQGIGTPLHLALNAPVYDPGIYPSLLRLVDRCVGWGVAGVIAGDLGLLIRLAEAAFPLELTLSTMAGALNRRSVGFFRRFGIARAVLPRHLTLGEMASIVNAHPSIAFEAFVLVGRCPNEEAFCTFQHVNPEKHWPCEIRYDFAVHGERGFPEGHPLAAWNESWREADRRHACGLCGIAELARIGVRHLKIVGRGGPSEAKVANVGLVSRFARGNTAPSQAPAAYAERFGRPCHPLVCYFPELR